MNTRERFHAVMNFKPFDRLPIIEWAIWWNKTIERWHGEGLPPSVKDRYDLYRHFGQDVYFQHWIRCTAPGCPAPAHHGAGIITDEADYNRIKPMLYPAECADLPLWEKSAKEQSAGNAVLWFTVEGFFWFPRVLFGIERHLYAFYDQPDLMHRINSDLADFMIKAVTTIQSVCQPDFMTFAEDMSYNHGPMLSQELFDEFMLPYYRRVIPYIRKSNTIPIVDSDGDITVPAPWFEKAGIDGILPLERQAGVDIAVLRRQHPRMRFIGHFDKMVMNKGDDALRTEFARIAPTAALGGWIPSVDHQTPPGVSYREYLSYMSMFREFAGETGRLSKALKT